MSAGQIWRRPDGLRWVEIQADAMEPSGWRLMVPLVPLDQAPDAPPLVVTLNGIRARVHLLTSVPDGDRGEPTGALFAEGVERLQAAARCLITVAPSRHQPGLPTPMSASVPDLSWVALPEQPHDQPR